MNLLGYSVIYCDDLLNFENMKLSEKACSWEVVPFELVF